MKAVSKLIVLTALVTLVACSKENNPKDENDDNKANPVLTVKLVDAPSVYDAVNVEILYMKFINGNSMLLIGDTSVSPGVITELRLVLGNNNSVIVDGESYELQTPSGQSSGYKIKMDPQPLVPGGIYSLVVDFDVSESVHRTGGGKYMLKPVVRGYLEDAIGGISGTIFPFTESFFVEAVNLTDTAGTLTDPLTGEFLIGTVLPGTYNVTIYASPSFSDTTITGVIVSAGQITQIDTVFLQ
jgi:hypothetical protein